MKTTIYELLGMIKDGKAPKKIKFNNIYCYYRECKNEYVDYTNKPIIQWDYVIMNSLNDEVEILETTITYNQDNYIQYQPYTGEVEIKCNSPKTILESNKIEKLERVEDFKFARLIDKINEIIEVLNER